jgi:hypothetical protein
MAPRSRRRHGWLHTRMVRRRAMLLALIATSASFHTIYSVSSSRSMIGPSVSVRTSHLDASRRPRTLSVPLATLTAMIRRKTTRQHANEALSKRTAAIGEVTAKCSGGMFDALSALGCAAPHWPVRDRDTHRRMRTRASIRHCECILVMRIHVCTHAHSLGMEVSPRAAPPSCDARAGESKCASRASCMRSECECTVD